MVIRMKKLIALENSEAIADLAFSMSWKECVEK